MRRVRRSLLDMKSRFYLLVFLLWVSFNGYGAKNVLIDGIKYTISGVGTKGIASVSVPDKKVLPSDVIIPDHIILDGREYPVTEIETNAFRGCKNLKTIVLPSTINKIGRSAFWNCPDLISAILPDQAEVVLDKGNYGFGEAGIFKDCPSLENVNGISVPYPPYIVYDCILNCQESPFYKKVQELGAVSLTRFKNNKTFSEYTAEKVKKPIEDWQKRKDYETVAQWESRVTESNRKRMIDEYLIESKKEYVKELAPSILRGSLENYNPEYEFFVILTPTMGNLYVNVPKEEEEFFIKNWNKVILKPDYGILDGELSVLDCDFIIDGKVYKSVRTFDEDDLSLYAQNITSLASLKEYEQMIASESANLTGSRRDKYSPDIIDIEIPEAIGVNSRTFAVIIGNENYQRVAPVEYAMNDARIFEKYCNRTLGIPEKNIRTYYDASYGDMVVALEDITLISEAYNGDINLIFYYAGHGVPDEKSRDAYLLPIDATGNQLSVCYPMNSLFEQLGNLNANQVIVFLDACFSGSLRGDGMLASSRGIKLKPKDIVAKGNLVVLSATTADQSAFPYHEKNHGLFSYYLLKKLSDSKGEVTLGELSDFIITEVSRQSILENKKPQIPSVKFSNSMTDNWRSISLKK
ncbi:MAG: caspase family protein [Muribaculaceae bacterium]|nr:caspase family protein [Muribaculaceae bacterium]